MANRVHASMDSMQPPRPHPPEDRVFADAYPAQLADRDNPVLSLSDPGKCPIPSGAFPVHKTAKEPSDAASPPPGPESPAASGRIRLLRLQDPPAEHEAQAQAPNLIR